MGGDFVNGLIGGRRGCDKMFGVVVLVGGRGMMS